MALGARALPPPAAAYVPALDVCSARPRSGNSGGGEPSATMGAAVSVDTPALWSDEGRMKRELLHWARAVASMAIMESLR